MPLSHGLHDLRANHSAWFSEGSLTIRIRILARRVFRPVSHFIDEETSTRDEVVFS